MHYGLIRYRARSQSPSQPDVLRHISVWLTKEDIPPMKRIQRSTIRCKNEHICVRRADIFASNNFQWARKQNTDSSRIYTTSVFLNEKSKNESNAFKELYGLPFSISPDHAFKDFEKWARKDQGLGTFLLNLDDVRIAATYTPVWSFTLNVRFVLIDNNNSGKPNSPRRRLDWKPEIFQDAYGSNQSVVHLPGLSSYAGYSYSRSLIDPLHNSTLLFMGQDAVPFGGWMMRDMKFGDKELQVTPDPWNATRGLALAAVKNNLEQLCNSASNLPSKEHTVKIQTEVLSYRRVYMPTYVIDYKILSNVTFQAFVSGCDSSSGVSGVSHKVFGDTNPYDLKDSATSFMDNASSLVHRGTNLVRRVGLGNREVGQLMIVFINIALGLLGRFLGRIPVIGFFGGLFIGFRKIMQPWMSSRLASTDWTRQRKKETEMKIDHTDDFVDSGSAERFFQNNREQILRKLNNEDHVRGDFDWYDEWGKWARQQWDQQQTGQSFDGNRNREQFQHERKTSQRDSSQYQWDFDPLDS